MKSTALSTKLLALAGIAALLVQLNAVPLDYMLFRLNQPQIAQTMCEHKKPNCNGHCFLMKQMAQSTNAAKDKNTERIGGQLDGHFLLSALSNLTLFPFSEVNFFNGLDKSVAFGWDMTVLQPPRA